jgi:hypothetical protein
MTLENQFIFVHFVVYFPLVLIKVCPFVDGHLAAQSSIPPDSP